MASSGDGSYLISGDSGSRARPRDESPLFVFDMQSGRLALRVNAYRGGIRSIAVDPDGQFIASGGVDGVWVWNIKHLTYPSRGRVVWRRCRNRAFAQAAYPACLPLRQKIVKGRPHGRCKDQTSRKCGVSQNPASAPRLCDHGLSTTRKVARWDGYFMQRPWAS
jgi:hypothetical protein